MPNFFMDKLTFKAETALAWTDLKDFFCSKKSEIV